MAAADICVMATGSGGPKWNLGSGSLILIVAVLAVLFVFAATRHKSSQAGIGSPVSVTDGSSMGPANKPLPAGEWDATGTVERGQRAAFTNEPIGSVLHRPWTFTKVCKDSCQIVFLRQTLYGPSAAELTSVGSERYIATFPPVRVPCAYRATYSGPRRLFGESHDYYVLSGDLAGDELRATEQQTQTGCYPDVEPPDLTQWRAVRSPQT